MQELELPETPPPLPDERRRRGGRVLIIVNGVIAFVILAALVRVGPVFEAIFKDFGAKLPALTQLMIDLSNLLKSWWWLIGMPVGGGLVSLGLLLDRHDKPVVVRRYLVGLLVAQILFVGFMIVAILLPILQLASVAGGL